MERIPVLRVGSILVVSIQVDLHDTLAEALQEDIGKAIDRHNAQGVLIDISGLDVVDSFIGATLGRMAEMAKLLGAELVIAGMRPAVAITLVELGVDLPEVGTAMNVDRGLALLRQSLKRRGG